MKVQSLLVVAALSLVSFATAEKPAEARAHTNRCHSNADCGELEFCDIEADTDADAVCGGAGVCTARGIGNMCPMIDVRACGCDGKPYANACLAHKAGATIDPSPFKDANVDGDTLAEQSWMDAAQSNFYTFTGNGTAENYSGTFQQLFAPACTRAAVRCMIAETVKTGKFYTFDSFVELDFDSGDVQFFDAQLDCHNTWKLVADDGTTTLMVSTVAL
jgi:hypothetical protein